MKDFRKSTVILYILVLILFGWLSYACYCNLKFDANSSAGLIVSALCVLVTALMGWQVYNAIEIRKSLNKFQELSININYQISLLKNKDIESQRLCEAYFLMHLSQDNKDWNSIRYGQLGQSFLYFILAKVENNYHPLHTLLGEMGSILNNINENKKENEIHDFVDRHIINETLYKEIMRVLNNENTKYNNLKSKIASLRDKRLEIVRPYLKSSFGQYAEYADMILSPFVFINSTK